MSASNFAVPSLAEALSNTLAAKGLLDEALKRQRAAGADVKEARRALLDAQGTLKTAEEIANAAIARDKLVNKAIHSIVGIDFSEVAAVMGKHYSPLLHIRLVEFNPKDECHRIDFGDRKTLLRVVKGNEPAATASYVSSKSFCQSIQAQRGYGVVNDDAEIRGFFLELEILPLAVANRKLSIMHGAARNLVLTVSEDRLMNPIQNGVPDSLEHRNLSAPVVPFCDVTSPEHAATRDTIVARPTRAGELVR